METGPNTSVPRHLTKTHGQRGARRRVHPLVVLLGLLVVAATLYFCGRPWGQASDAATRDASGQAQPAPNADEPFELRGLDVAYASGTTFRVAANVGSAETAFPNVEYRFTWASGENAGEVRSWGPSPVCSFDTRAIGAAATTCTIVVEARDEQGTLGREERVLSEDDLRDARVELYVEGMSMEHKVAQLFVVKPEVLVESGTVIEPSDELSEGMSWRCVGGIMLMGANLVDPEQTRWLNESLKEYGIREVGLAPLVCVDEEGGTVTRVAGNSAFGVDDPGNMCDIGATGDVDYAQSEAERMGTYLRDLGFTVDFAPDADISSGPGNFIEWRSFGEDAELVSSMVAAQVRGFSSAGVLSTVKHFPGIGAAEGDSHFGTIYSYASEQDLKGWELRPFEAAIDEGVPLVMVGHISCVGYDGGEMPASLSEPVVTGLLRDYLGYDGLVITDSLGMGAVNENFDSYEVGVLALEAGCDLFLSPADFESCYQGVMDAVDAGTISRERLDASVRRIVRAKLSIS